MEPYGPHPSDGEDSEDLYNELFSVASMTECTGLIPSAPENEAEVDSYSEIYDIPMSGDAKAANHGLQDVEKKKSHSTHQK